MGCGCGKKLDKSKLQGATAFPASVEGLTRVKLTDVPDLMNALSAKFNAPALDTKPSDTE